MFTRAIRDTIAIPPHGTRVDFGEMTREHVPGQLKCRRCGRRNPKDVSCDCASKTWGIGRV